MGIHQAKILGKKITFWKVFQVKKIYLHNVLEIMEAKMFLKMMSFFYNAVHPVKVQEEV